MLSTAIRRRLMLTIMGALLMTMSLLLAAPIPAFAQKTSPALSDTSTVSGISLSFRGGTNSQHSQVVTAWSNAVNRALSASMRSPDYRYTTWFGPPYRSYYDYVIANYKRVYGSMWKDQYTIDLTGTGSSCSNAYAYTKYGTMTIWLCEAFWTLPMSGLDSKTGTLLHEVTHDIAGTFDYTYGEANCEALAAINPFKAVHNAANYKYFAMAA